MTQLDLLNRRAYIIGQLRGIGIHKSRNNTPIELMEYRELKYLLAAKQAVAQ